MSPREDLFVSVVAPLRNDADILASFVQDTTAVLDQHYTHFELVLVDDGSSDGTAEAAREAVGKHGSVRVIRLSRPFGTEIAISAGLESAIGDFVVVMLPETDPPALIPSMVERSRQGAGVVFGMRAHRRGQSWLTRAGTAAFYWLANRVFRLDLPADATHYRVLSRQVVNALTQIRDRNRYLQTLSAYVGYRNQAVSYEVIARRHPARRKTLGESVGLAMNILVTTSVKPLYAVVWIGALAVVANLGFLLYVVAVYLFKPTVAEGWTTESFVMAVMFGALSLLGTVVAAYLARLLDESADRPLYFVQEEISAGEPRGLTERNVVADPVDRRSS